MAIHVFFKFVSDSVVRMYFEREYERTSSISKMNYLRFIQFLQKTPMTMAVLISDPRCYEMIFEGLRWWAATVDLECPANLESSCI